MMVEIVRSTGPRCEELVGVGATTRHSHTAETDFGSVHPAHRGRGLGSALGSHAIIMNYWAQHRDSVIGGTAVNDASKATVTLSGFTSDELWRSYGPPVPGGNRSSTGRS